MPRNLRELRAWARSHEGKKIIRFTTTSIISTLISETVILFLYGLRIVPGAIQATLIGDVAAMLPAYHLNRRWAWGTRGRSRVASEVVPYLTMSLSGTVVALLGATYAQHLVHVHHWSHLVNTAVVGGTNIVSFGVFWILKMLLFNRIFHPGGRATRERVAREDQRGSRD